MAGKILRARIGASAICPLEYFPSVWLHQPCADCIGVPRGDGWARKSEPQFAFDEGLQILYLYALLLHGIAVAHGDGTVGFGIKVHGDAVRRADFILAAIALAL